MKTHSENIEGHPCADSSHPAPEDRLLSRLVAHGEWTQEELAALQDWQPTPWWLEALLGLAAWISALFLLGAFLLPLSLAGDHWTFRCLLGGLLLALAVYLFRSERAFVRHLALAISLGGQGTVVIGLVLGFDFGSVGAALIWSFLALLMLYPPSSKLHRTLCVLLVASGAMVLTWESGAETLGLAGWGLLSAALACGLWMNRSRWAAGPYAAHLAPCAHAASLLAILLAVLGHRVFQGSFEASSVNDVWVLRVYGFGAGLVLLGSLGFLLRAQERAQASDAGGSGARLGQEVGHEAGIGGSLRLGLIAGLALSLLLHAAPGLLISMALALAAFHGGSRGWLQLALVAALLYLGELYYSLHISLLHKSALLVGAGAVLLILRQGLQRAVREQKT